MRWLSEASPQELHSLVDRGEFFWLDLVAPTQGQVAKLAEAAGVDPEAADRALHFGEAPQLRLFRGQSQLVFYGAQPTANGPLRFALVEVRVYVSDQWVVSVREGSCRALEDLPGELDNSPPATEKAIVARVLGALAGIFEGPLDSVAKETERLEEAAAEVTRPAPTVRREILADRGYLFSIRRLVGRQRDYIEHAVDEIRDLPGFDSGEHHELRDVVSEMIRVADRVDHAVVRLSGALEQLRAVADDRLNVAMARLTVVATIFLPLTLVTGFFGMNFGWMLRRMTGLGAFLVGVGLFAVSGVLIYLWLRSRLLRPNGG